MPTKWIRQTVQVPWGGSTRDETGYTFGCLYVYKPTPRSTDYTIFHLPSRKEVQSALGAWSRLTDAKLAVETAVNATPLWPSVNSTDRPLMAECLQATAAAFANHPSLANQAVKIQSIIARIRLAIVKAEAA